MSKELAITLEDKPGTLAKLTEALGAAGVNIENAYVAGGGYGKKKKIVIITADAEKAKGLL